MPSVELTPEELELLADMAALKAREHWRLTVQARTEKERTYGLFLDGSAASCGLRSERDPLDPNALISSTSKSPA